MRKILIIITFIFLGVLPACADTMAVQAVTDISTCNPNDVVKVKVLRDCTLAGTELKIGYILEGKIIPTKPKRLKRDATFTFYPINYFDLNGKELRFSTLYYGKFSKKFEIDCKKLAESAVVTVANHLVKGISVGFYAVQGAVQNEEDNVVTSAVHNVYEHSFLSYVEKGKELNIHKDSIFGLKFSECENAPIVDAE